MKILSKSLILVVFSLFLSCSDAGTVATVESTRITAQELDTFCQKKAALLGVEKLSGGEKREVLESLIKKEVVYRYAQKASVRVPVDPMKEAQKKLSFFERIFSRREVEKTVIFDQVYNQITGSIGSTGKEIRAYYDVHKDEFAEPERYRVYLVKVEEADIGHVSKKLRDYPDAFDDMALQRVSKDLREINRNAPYVPKSEFPEEMWPYLEKMKVGEIAGPVTVKKGTFLFKLVDKRRAYLKPLSEVYIEIDHLVTAQKREEAFEKWYASIKGNYKIEIKEETF